MLCEQYNALEDEQAPWLVEAVLLERTLIAGKPQLKIVTKDCALSLRAASLMRGGAVNELLTNVVRD